MLIYFAGPLFCQAERAFNQQLARKLESAGFSIFLPQRDGIDLTQERLKGYSMEEISKKIFEIDRNKMFEADIFLLILDGRTPDEGACVALGLAYENKIQDNREKLLIGLLTDTRVFIEDLRLNPMITGALDCVVENEQELIREIQAFRNRKQALAS